MIWVFMLMKHAQNMDFQDFQRQKKLFLENVQQWIANQNNSIILSFLSVAYTYCFDGHGRTWCSFTFRSRHYSFRHHIDYYAISVSRGSKIHSVIQWNVFQERMIKASRNWKIVEIKKNKKSSQSSATAYQISTNKHHGSNSNDT